jgi:CRP-like cAMP-binding protein
MSYEASLALLPRLSENVRVELLALGTPRRHPRGAVILHTDDDGSQVLLMERGRAKVSLVSPSGREVIVEVFDDGCVLGELSAIDGLPRSATVTALTDLDLIVIRQSVFIEFLRRNADASMAVLELLVAKIRSATERELEFSTASALSRTCRALNDFADRYGAPSGDGVAVDVPLSQQELAAYAGLSREALVKALASLRSLGWITTSGRRYIILDADALSECSRGI